MKTILITGANRGIGLEVCRILKERGEQVIAVCRHPSDELKALSLAHILSDCDLNTQSVFKKIADNLKNLGIKKLDGVINNAGLLVKDDLSLSTDQLAESLEQQWRINSLAPILLTHCLLPMLDAGSKVVMVTSRMGSIEDNSSGGYYGYRSSKAALNMLGRSLSLDLKSRHIAVALVHPGYVRTQMTGYNGDLEPQQAAGGIVDRYDELDIACSGFFRHSNGSELPW